MKSILSSLFFIATLLFVANAQVNNVVIAALYGGGSNSGALYQNDFIELFNPTSSSQTLTDYSVQYASASASSWKVQTINAVMPAGSYYLVQLNGDGSAGVALPTADLIGTINMSATAGIVAFVNTSTALGGTGIGDSTVLDLVGYGATAAGYETNPAPGITSKKCLVRGGGGCTDVGDNSLDFTASTTFVPQNSASPVNPCNGLPVTLVSFVGAVVDGKAVLHWQTATEINFNEFIMEKSGGAGFVPIATISSDKILTGGNYVYTDAAILQDKQLYRLKLVDNDGRFRYGAIISVEKVISSINKINIYPNPVMNTVLINHPKATIGAVIRILNVDGRIVVVKSVALGATQTGIDVLNLPKASYLVSYENGRTRMVGQFVKE